MVGFDDSYFDLVVQSDFELVTDGLPVHEVLVQIPAEGVYNSFLDCLHQLLLPCPLLDLSACFIDHLDDLVLLLVALGT